MAGAISFGGLASGLDTNSIVNQLVAVEKLPITGYQTHQKNDQAKLSVIGDLLSKLQTLGAASDALTTSVGVSQVGATSSDASTVAVTGSDAAFAGTHAITVNNLSQTQVNTSTGFGTAGPVGTGSVSITVGTAAPFTISYAPTDQLADIATKINAHAGGATASVLYDGSKYKLVVSASQSGLANAMSFSETGATLGLPANNVVPPLDASLVVDGVAITRPSDHIIDAIPGLTIDLNAPTAQGAAPTKITVAPDINALTTKVQTLVTAYNAVAAVLNKQLTFTGAKMGPDTLFGDSGLESLQRELGGAFSGGYGSGKVSEGTLGIDYNKDGTMTFDSAKFATAMATDPSAALNLFTGNGGPTGLARMVSDIVTRYTEPVDGVLVTKQDSLNTDVTNYDALIATTTSAANSLQARLLASFTASEKAISLLQTQAAYLTAVTNQASSTSASSNPAASLSGKK